MFYLLCFGEDCFCVLDFDEQALAEEIAQKFVSQERYRRVVICESLSECILKEEDEEE